MSIELYYRIAFILHHWAVKCNSIVPWPWFDLSRSSKVKVHNSKWKPIYNILLVIYDNFMPQINHSQDISIFMIFPHVLNFDVSEITYFCVILCFRTTGTFFKKIILLLFLTCQITLVFFIPGVGSTWGKIINMLISCEWLIWGIKLS